MERSGVGTILAERLSPNQRARRRWQGTLGSPAPGPNAVHSCRAPAPKASGTDMASRSSASGVGTPREKASVGGANEGSKTTLSPRETFEPAVAYCVGLLQCLAQDLNAHPDNRYRKGSRRAHLPRGVDAFSATSRGPRQAAVAVPSIYSIVPPNYGSALRHGHHFKPVDFVIDHGRGHHDAYSAGSCLRTYARAYGCRQRPRRHREELIESERRWSGREAFVTMMQTADLGQGNDRSRPGRLNGSSIRCVLADRQVGP